MILAKAYTVFLFTLFCDVSSCWILSEKIASYFFLFPQESLHLPILSASLCSFSSDLHSPLWSLKSYYTTVSPEIPVSPSLHTAGTQVFVTTSSLFSVVSPHILIFLMSHPPPTCFMISLPVQSSPQ